MSLLRLPPELVYEVADHLSNMNCLHLSMTCRQLRMYLVPRIFWSACITSDEKITKSEMPAVHRVGHHIKELIFLDPPELDPNDYHEANRDSERENTTTHIKNLICWDPATDNSGYDEANGDAESENTTTWTELDNKDIDSPRDFNAAECGWCYESRPLDASVKQSKATFGREDPPTQPAVSSDIVYGILQSRYSRIYSYPSLVVRWICRRQITAPPDREQMQSTTLLARPL